MALSFINTTLGTTNNTPRKILPKIIKIKITIPKEKNGE